MQRPGGAFRIGVICVICGRLFMRALIIINKIAAKTRRTWPLIQRELDAAGIEYEAYQTNGPGDATARTPTPLQAGTTTIAVVGGDGTLSGTAQGFFEFYENI